VSDSPFSSARWLEQWALVNAIAVLAATGAAGAVGSAWPVVGTGVALLGGLVVGARDRWTDDGRFGAANAVTALRLGVLALLPLAAGAPAVLIGGGLCFLAADGLDGWLARRDGRASPFGAYFDKEADALFVLVLCALAVQEGHLPLWGLTAGLLRYTFVVTVFWLDPPEKTEARTSWARYVYAATVGALLFSFLPYPGPGRALVALATAALTLSFVWSLWRMGARRQPSGRG
jgi:phosphatidylglycerophosphate synthase